MCIGSDGEIYVVYEGGVFKPLKQVNLKEGIITRVVMLPEGLAEEIRRQRIKREAC